MRRLLTWLSGESEPVEGWEPRSGHPVHAVGVCANEDAIRELDQHGRCVTCGSSSVIRRGAVPEMQRLIRAAAARHHRELFELIVDRERPA